MKQLTFFVSFYLVAALAVAATFNVTKTADDPVDGCDADCSLREAVIAANQTPGSDTIVVPPGTYVLSLVGAGEDAAATGDLDLSEEVTIVGDPAGGTVIDGNLSDRLLHLDGATVQISDVTLTRGRTTGDFYGAGGILVEYGTLTLTRCTVSDCVTDGHGGGFFSLGVVTMDHSAVTGNAADHGGGIYHAGMGLSLINSTVSGNTAQTDGSGGVTVDGLALGMNVSSCTVSGNAGPESESMSLRTYAEIVNTIFDGSCAVIPGMGVVQSQGGNLESPGDTCGLDHAADIVGVSPAELNLGPLQDNGGVTPTHALNTGSFAIDSGNDMQCPGTDQRDWLREDGSCDIGAFEVGAVEPALFADGFESGTTSAWSAVMP